MYIITIFPYICVDNIITAKTQYIKDTVPRRHSTSKIRYREDTVHQRYGTAKTQYLGATIPQRHSTSKTWYPPPKGGIQKIEIFFVVVGENIKQHIRLTSTNQTEPNQLKKR